MIFVTIGTMYGFPRLIKEMDKIAGEIDEEVIMQIGETGYEPKNAKYFRTASREEMNQIYSNARLVVCHAGVGSILSAMDCMKPVLVIPRRKEFGEVIDDHQLEIAKELENEGKIKTIYDIDQLRPILKGSLTIPKIVQRENVLAGKLKVYLHQVEASMAIG